MVHRSFSSFFPTSGHLQLTITDLYVEQDNLKWYWRAVATFTSWLILSGFIVAPLGLHDSETIHLKAAPTTLRVVGTVLLLLGYISYIVLTLVCRSWLFWQEAIFTPAVSSSLFGLLSVILSMAVLPTSDDSGGFRAFLIILPSVFTFLGSLLIFFVSHRIRSIRSYDRKRRMRSSSTTSYNSAFPYDPDSDVVSLPPESEQQRKQLLRLLLNKRSDKPPSPDSSQATFRIDLPGEPHSLSARRAVEGYLALPESRGRRRNHEHRSTWQMQNLRNLIPGGKELQIERNGSANGTTDRSPSPRELRRVEIERGDGSPRRSQETISTTPSLSMHQQRIGGYV